MGDNKLKISFVTTGGWDMFSSNPDNRRTTITSFTIQDDNGIIYTFDQKGLSKILNIYPTSSDFLTRINQPSYEAGGVYYEAAFPSDGVTFLSSVVNSWYLKKIEDPLTHRSITLDYDVRSLKMLADHNIKSYKENGSIEQVYTNNENQKIFTDIETDTWYTVITRNVSHTLTPFVNAITYPDGQKVLFEYDTVHARIDVEGDYSLKSISATHNGRTIYQYQFTTSYFVLNSYDDQPWSAAEKRAARLCLRSIKKTGVDFKDDEAPYVFDYYLGTGINGDFVPPPFYYLKDIGGFYNGNRSNDKNFALNENGQNMASPIPYNAPISELNVAQLRA
ncbi:MAG: hypothetical protein HY305_00375, partial [Sphingobacteriales bacterium]|nr:hypothetical protein [Sphingobacteriales bacterium]